MKRVVGALMIAWAAASGAWAAEDDRWIHIRVDDNGGAGGHVDIQLPIGMVRSLLPAIEANGHGGGLRVGRGDVDLREMRAYWAAVRDSKDGDYVTVRDEDSRVRIAKSAGYLLVHVDESSGGARVRMKIPTTLVDAVFAGGDEVDLEAVGKALAKVPSGEIISVDDEDSHVRIWIDATPTAAREDAR